MLRSFVMKRILSLILVMSMLVVACGNKEADNETKTKKVSVAEQKVEYDSKLKDDYGEWFDGDLLKEYDGRTTALPEDIYKSVNTKTLLVDCWGKDRTRAFPLKFDSVADAYGLWYGEYGVLVELKDREDAGLVAYDYIDSLDANNIEYNDLGIFFESMYLLSLESSFNNLSDEQRKTVINKCNEVLESNQQPTFAYGFECLILAVERDCWIDYIDDNNLLDSEWKSTNNNSAYAVEHKWDL